MSASHAFSCSRLASSSSDKPALQAKARNSAIVFSMELIHCSESELTKAPHVQISKT
jgi:hypothetical protein